MLRCPAARVQAPHEADRHARVLLGARARGGRACCGGGPLQSEVEAGGDKSPLCRGAGAERAGRLLCVGAGSRGTGGIKGAYERVPHRYRELRQYLSQSVAGYFRRSTDGATMEMIYERKYPRACPHPGGKRTRVRRIRVLGVRMGVWRVRYNYSTVPVYEVRGTLRRRDLRLSVVGGNVETPSGPPKACAGYGARPFRAPASTGARRAARPVSLGSRASG